MPDKTVLEEKETDAENPVTVQKEQEKEAEQPVIVQIEEGPVPDPVEKAVIDAPAGEPPATIETPTEEPVAEPAQEEIAHPDEELGQTLRDEFLPGWEASSEKEKLPQTGDSTVLRITDLKKDYRIGWLQHRKFRALDGVSLEVRAGEIYGFLGPNGAGKTTTIKCMLGITKPSSGSVEVFGRKTVSKAARAKIGYSPEMSYYYKYLTAREILKYYGKLFAIPRRELTKKVDWVLDMVGLYEHRNRMLKKFSKGMLQRVGLAQALINDPSLLIMDEPTAGLDPLMKKEMRDLILSLNEQGKTIFFSSHELSEVEMICHRVAILDKGKLIIEGTLSDILPADPGLTVVVKSLAENVESTLREHGVSVSRADDAVHVHCGDNGGIYDVLALLARNACDLIEIQPHKRTLEDFFIKTVSEWKDEGGTQ